MNLEQITLVYFRMVPLPFPFQKHKGIFIQYSLWEPAQVPRGKTTKVWKPPMTGNLRFYVSDFCMLNLQQSISYSYFPTKVMVPVKI